MFGSKHRSKPFNITKRKLNDNVQKATISNTSTSRILPSILKFGFSSLGGIATACLLKSQNSIVQSKTLKLPKDVKHDDKELSFKWKKFLTYLYPYFWQLLVALSVSICE